MRAQITTNGNASAEYSVFGVEYVTTPMNLSYTSWKGNTNQYASKQTIAGSTTAPVIDASNYSDDVQQVELVSPVEAIMRSGVYSSGFPSQESLRNRRWYANGNVNPAITASADVQLVFAATTGNTANHHVAKLLNLKVEVYS